MKFIWPVFKYIYWLWAIVLMFLFLTTSVVYSAIVLLIFRKNAQPFLIACYKFWANVFCIGTFVNVKVHNYHIVKAASPCIVVSNHCSNIDMFLGAIGLPYKTKPLGKIELKKIPLLGFLFSVGAILVDRKSRESREKSIFRIREEMNKGNNVFIYPEGTRNKTKQPLGDFYDGAFRFAIESNSPLVVMISINAKQIVPATGLYLRPGRIDLYYLPVYETKNLNQTDIQELKQKVYNDMEAFILKHDPAFQKS